MKQQPLDLKPEDLHNWYLEATKELNPESYNLHAQKPFSELTEEQKFIDKFICDKVKHRLKSACEFYMRYMDKPYTFLSEQWERAQKEKIKEKFYTKGYGWSLYDYNDWLFRFTFKDVLGDDIK